MKSNWWRGASLPAAAVVVSLLLPVATFLVVALLAGWRLEAVESGSMEPLYPVGSLIVVHPVDPSNVKVGMPLAFVPDDGRRLVTHRVVEVREGSGGGGLMFRTKGDANAGADPDAVFARAVRGQAKWAVPQLGRVVRWLAWPRGFLLLVGGPALLLAISEVRARRGPTRDALVGAGGRPPAARAE